MNIIPPYIDNEISTAEKKLIRLLSNDDKFGNWYCFHSLGISRHISKREGEIDFLLVGPEGVFVIEVKGGRVQRKNGFWLFTDRYGRITKKRESPFTQARSALYSLRDTLSKKFGQSIKKHVFGYGVAFPDIVFDIDSPEWDSEIIFDNSNLNKPISDYMRRLTDYWSSRQKNPQAIDPNKVSEIADYLRRDFEAVYPVSSDLRESEDQILELTKEQYVALDAMEQNPRLIFSGSAGTGKTLLAIEKVRRNNAKGISTLLLCFNRLLGSYLSEVVRQEKLHHVKAYSLHQFFYEHLLPKEKTDLKQYTGNKNLFTEIYPKAFLDSLQKQSEFEELVIDEGQDIITKQYISALDPVISDGFNNGRWTLFIDPRSQKDMFSEINPEVYDRLKKLAATYQLSVNCRNTKPIALQAEVVTGYPLGKIKKTKGLPVRYLWYSSSSDQAHQVSQVVNDLLRDGVAAEEITILSPKRYQDSLAGSGRLRLNAGFYRLGANRFGKKDLIGCGTIQSYKGMENSIVILTDIENLDSKESKTVNYVGFTRPRSMLIVSINRKQKPIYETYFSGIVTGEVQ